MTAAAPPSPATRDSGAPPLTAKQRWAGYLIAFGEFIDGYDLLVMGVALLLLKPQFGLTNAQVGMLGAATFLGAAVGLLIFGDLSDRLGRRAIFITNLMFFVVFAVASAFVTQTWELFLVRFMIGVGVGMDIPTSTSYLAEIAPKERRGALLGSLLNIMWTLGALTSTLIALPLTLWFGDAAWRWMFGLAAVPAIIVQVARRSLPESPRWLLARGHIDEARAAFAIFGIDADQALRDHKPSSHRVSYRDLFQPAWRGRLILVTTIFVLNCLSGSITTICAPLVLKQVGAMSNTAAMLFSASVWVVALAGTVVSSVFIDRIGRRTLCYGSVIAFGLGGLFLAVFGERSVAALVGGIYFLSFVVWMGIAVLTWTWAAELFPTEVRARAQGVCNAGCRLAIAANIFLAPMALAQIGFSAYIAILSAPMFLIALIVAFSPVLNSGGRDLEDLAHDI